MIARKCSTQGTFVYELMMFREFWNKLVFWTSKSYLLGAGSP
jgi:hypothetical protein